MLLEKKRIVVCRVGSGGKNLESDVRKVWRIPRNVLPLSHPEEQQDLLVGFQ